MAGEAQIRLPPQKWVLLAASLAVGAYVAFLFQARRIFILPPWLRLSRLFSSKAQAGQADPPREREEWEEREEEEGEGKQVRKPVRVFMDGCFDLMHLGHANGLRQAKALGDVLVVGVCSEEEMRENKGPPVLTTDERLALVGAVKWVDEVIPDTPYCITPEFLHSLFTTHSIDYVVHGDDPCLLPDGSDAYASAKQAGKYKEFKRTEGVSSTDILSRILTCAKIDMTKQGSQGAEGSQGAVGGDSTGVSGAKSSTPEDKGSPVQKEMALSTSKRPNQFFNTARRIAQFADLPRPLNPAQRVVYIDGAFDLFHAGHVATLEDARSRGDYLLVGVHADEVVSANRGPHHPVMCLHERCMSVLSCRHVNDVIIGAPWVLTKDLITTFNVSLVVRGSVREANPLAHDEEKRFKVAEELGILEVIKSRRDATTSSLLKRVLAGQEEYESRHEKRSAKEQKYYGSKEYVVEH